MNRGTAILRRWKYHPNHTFGILSFTDENHKWQGDLFTLELPQKGNAKNVSCIPEGVYLVERHTSPTKGDCYRVMDTDETHVDGRSHILIHKGNYQKDTQGCILPGLGMADINSDGEWDVTNSALAMAKIRQWQPDAFILHVT